MKKFKFQLEGLLTLRDWEEQKARQALGEVTSRIARLKQEISDLEASKAALFASWNEGAQKRFSPRERIAMDAQAALYGKQAIGLEAKVQEVEGQRAKAIQNLKAAARAKQVVENLKEKRLEEFQAEFFRQEAREIEDIFNSRHKGELS